jgi:hypothetical protein
MNWQPLNLEDLQRFEMMGGSMDEMAGFDGDLAEAREASTRNNETGTLMDENDTMKRCTSPDAEKTSGFEICAKAFAYSRLSTQYAFCNEFRVSKLNCIIQTLETS